MDYRVAVVPTAPQEAMARPQYHVVCGAQLGPSELLAKLSRNGAVFFCKRFAMNTIRRFAVFGGSNFRRLCI
jgi:hypothetical protein